MKTAILYIRVSTDEQAEKGYSQRNQDEVLHKYSALKSLQVQDVIYEDHSAKTFNRPEWNNMLNKLKKLKGKAAPDFILFTKWDRFSRNAGDAYQMITILRSFGTEPQAIEQPLDLTIPENKMMLAFYLAAPEVENDRRALNIFHGMRRAKKEGRWVATAPTGYVNKTTENGRKYIRPSEPLAGIMKHAFSEIATGKYAVEQVWKQAKRNGLPCSRNNFWNMIRNPVYCGKIVVPSFQDETLQLVEGQHDPIITSELFRKVQDVLDGRKVARRTKVVSPDELPLRGFLTCPKCGRMMTGSASKGRNAYYHYYHCSAACGVRYKADEVNSALSNLFKKFVPKNPFKVLYKEIARDVFKQQTSDKHNQRQQNLLQMETQRVRLKKARELLLNEAIGVQDFYEIKKECEDKIRLLEKELKGLPDMDETITKVLNGQSKKFLDLHDLYRGATVEDKRELIGKIFSKSLIVKDNKLSNTPLIKAMELIFNNHYAKQAF